MAWDRISDGVRSRITAVGSGRPMSDENSSLSEEQRDERSSISQLEAGGITPEAARRLRELSERGAFSSDLSVADFALCHQLGLKPLSQVMGTSVYQIGYQAPLWGAEGAMTALSTISAAWNQARDRSFARLAQEAQSVGASAVVGVSVGSSVGDWAQTGGYGAGEYLVTGTAVSRAGAGDRPHDLHRLTVLTEL